MTVQYHCHVSSSVSLYTDRQTEGTQAVQVPLIYRTFPICCEFAEYDLFKTLIYIPHLIHISFDLTLTQFHECQILEK